MSVGAPPPPPPPLVVLSRSEATTQAMGAAWSRTWAASAEPLAVLTLSGPLGAGKTQLAKGVVAGLGGDPHEVTSPTFTLLDIHASPIAEVHHFDCYRLDSAEGIFDVGLESSLATPPTGAPRRIVLIEWASRVTEWLPPATQVREVELEHVSETIRRLSWHGLASTERAALRTVAGDPSG